MRNCKTNKKVYRTQVDGQIALSNIHLMNTKHRKRKTRDEPVRVYPCGFCGFFHLTSQPKDSTQGLLRNRDLLEQG